MKCSKTDGGIVFKGVRDFDLRQTLDCGQSFRWEELDDGGFVGVAFGREVTVRLSVKK